MCRDRCAKLVLIFYLILSISCDDEGDNYPVRSCKVKLIYDSNKYEPVSSGIFASGEWNGWSEHSDELHDKDGDGIYELELELPEGEYGYKFIKDGKWILDPSNPQRKWVNGIENSNLIVKNCHKPLLELEELKVNSKEGSIYLKVRYIDSAKKYGPDPESLYVTVNEMKIDNVPFNERERSIVLELKDLVPNRYTLKMLMKDKHGNETELFFLPVWIEEEEWKWEDALIYFAFTDRFFNGDPSNDRPIDGIELPANYQGGDLEGIIKKIEEGYFDELGVSAIWISPIDENPEEGYIGHDGHLYTGYHGYWPSESRKVESRFGELESLKRLTSISHSHGIRVILDVVLNHVHKNHPYYREHPEWFNGDGSCVCGVGSCDWDSHRIDCWFTNYLPDIDYGNHAAVIKFVDDALWWVIEGGIDGFRVDAVKHFYHVVPRRLSYLLNEIFERGGVRFYMVGETFTWLDGRWQIAEYVGPDELDGQFDFPIYWSILYTFAEESRDLRWLDEQLKANENFYPEGTVMSPFLGNHDVPRFISQANGDGGNDPWQNPPSKPASSIPYQKLKLAFTFLLTIPGAPLIYYGDEIGMPGARDPDNRRMMRFEPELDEREKELLNHVRLLGKTRKENVLLRRGKRETIYVRENLYVYIRRLEDKIAIIVINRDKSSVNEKIFFPRTVPLTNGMVFRDIFTSRRFTVRDYSIDISLEEMSSLVLLPENN